MQSAYQAKGLDHWTQILEPVQLPVPYPSITAIKRLLVDPDSSLNQIGNLVATDPVLRFLVVRACNQRFARQAAGALVNPHHCVSMMGLDQLSALVDSLVTLDPGRHRFSAHYLQSIALSQYAADQALSWAPFRHQGDLDQLLLACLLHGVANWALWQLGRDQARIIDHLVFQQGVAAEKAELAVLGCERAELSQALAQRWRFPPMVCQCLHGAALPSARFLVRSARQALRHPDKAVAIRWPNKTQEGVLANTQALTVSLSNYLAQLTSQDWYSKRTLRSQAMLAAYLDLPLKRTLESTKSVALGSSLRFAWAPIQTPAESLLWPPARPHRRLRPSQLGAAVQKLWQQLHAPAKDVSDTERPRPAIRPTAAQAGFVSIEQQRQFNSLLEKLQQRPPAFDNSKQMLRAVVDTLADCTQLERVVVALLNPGKDALQADYCRGCDAAPGLQALQIELQPPNLLTQLLKQQAAIWVNRDSPLKAGSMVPEALRQARLSDQFLLMSVFDRLGPYGVFYADRGISGSPGLSDAHYKIFKAACSHCQRYLLACNR